MTQKYAINMPMKILGPVEEVTAKSSPGRVGTFLMTNDHNKTPGSGETSQRVLRVVFPDAEAGVTTYDLSAGVSPDPRFC